MKMNFEWRTGARTSLLLILIASGCGGRNQPAPETHTAPAQEPPSGAGVELTGKLASSLAPPSALMVVEPASPVELPVKAEPAIMDQAGYEFLPAFLIAQAGQNVQFCNSENVLHNVRVTEKTTQQPVFNVATLASGKHEHKFEPGYYTVSCDIHSTMRADILVTATPYTASTGTDGCFTIANVRPGAVQADCLCRSRAGRESD